MNSEKIQEDDTFSTVQHAEICSVESTSVNKPYHLKRSIKDRHIQMIALGGRIGTGLFVASGKAIATGGPAGAMLAYMLIGAMVYCVIMSLDTNRVSALIIGVSNPATEVVAAGVILQYWAPNLATWIPALIFIVVLVLTNLLGVQMYGELEYWFALIKVMTCVLFIFVGIFVDAGVAGGNKISFTNWTIDGAPFVGGALSVFTTCLLAFFSFGGTEMVGITAGESSNPRKAVPKAISQVFWRILLFYVLSIFIIGLCIPYDDPSLLDSAYGDLNSAVKVAPFTKVFQMANLPGADHAVNAVLLTSVLSAGNSCFYACTRTLMALGREGKAPLIFGKCNSRGVPVYALAVTTIFACLAFLADIFGSSNVFAWLINLTGLSALLTWMCISIIHLRFRHAFKVQGRDLKDLPYRAPLFPYGCYIAILLCLVVLVSDIYYAATTTPFEPVNFVGVLIKRTKFVSAKEADLDTGRSVAIEEVEGEQTKKKWWTKVISILA
ncbi:unnamed protein product [Umbelopsis vinacea]